MFMRSGVRLILKSIKADDIIINEEVKKNKNVDLGDGYTNVALFGVDSRDGDLGEGNRTDCIIVASLNNKTKEIKMVSVYRDTLLDLSEGTYQKCNAAYSYGGPVLAINMLNMNLDLDIQDYVTVDFGAIADAVDLLGGIEVEVTEEELPYINNIFLKRQIRRERRQIFFKVRPSEIRRNAGDNLCQNSFYGRRRFYSYGASAPCNRKNV